MSLDHLVLSKVWKYTKIGTPQNPTMMRVCQSVLKKLPGDKTKTIRARKFSSTGL